MKKILEKFNPRAFLFNSFYFFYKGIRSDVFFFFFIATPLLFYFLSKTNMPATVSATAAILAVRLAAGLSAGHFLQNYTRQQNSDQPPKPVLYFSVSALRVVVFTFLSFNLYPVYLAYKNWQAVRNDSDEKSIFPFFRGVILAPIYAFPLFWRMHKSFAAVLKKTFLFDLFAVLYLSSLVAGTVIHYLIFAKMNFWLFGLFMLLQLIKPLLLLPVQYTINRYNQTVDPENKPHKNILPGEVIVILITLAIGGMIYSFTRRFTIIEFYRNFDRPTRNMIINSYIFQDGYEEICARYGYQMKLYGPAFRRIYKNELERLELILKTNNMTTEDALNVAGPYFKRSLNRRLERELIALSTEIMGTKSSETRQNMYNLCSFMDMSADLVIKSQLKK